MWPLLQFGAVTLDRVEVQGLPMASHYGFAEVKRLVGLPLLQQAADAPRKTTIQLRLVDEFVDVDVRIAAFQAHAATKAAALLVFIPTGSPIGWFVTEKIDVTPLMVGRLGETRAADIGLAIREAPADRVKPAIVSPALERRRSTVPVRRAS